MRRRSGELNAGFQCASPASLEALEFFERESSTRLPDEYRRFLLLTNGGEGFVGCGSYVLLWKVEDILQFNIEYQVNDYAAGLLLFGSSGGGEALGFDLRDGRRAVVSVPFVGMDLRRVTPLAGTFDDFLGHPNYQSDAKPLTSQEPDGVEIFEIHPIILGGNPTEASNKTLLTRKQHIEAVRYWNQTVRLSQAHER